MKSPKIETTKKFKHYGEKVKQLDFHPVLPLVLLAQYNGHLSTYNYMTQAFVKKIEVSSKPLRCGIWAGEDCVLTSGDDNQVRLFNFHSTQKLHQFEPHKDFIRKLIFNKKQNYILSCSDDKTIVKHTLTGSSYVRDFTWEEHKHFVMDIQLDPKEENTFASASLDGTLKLWNVKSSNSNFTLKGHKSGVNCVAFCGADRPLMLSGGDDFVTILWDLVSRTVLRRLEHHSGNVMDVLFLDPLPFFVSLAEDGKINFYNTRSFEFSFEVNNFMGKGWSLSSVNGLLAAGYDEGAVVLRLGAETQPAACAQGRLLLVSSGEALTCNLKALQLKQAANFDRIDFDSKELGRPEIFPSRVSFSESGNIVCLQDGSDFVLYKFQGFKMMAYGKAKDFVWSQGNQFAILTDRNEVAIGSVPSGEAGSAVATDMSDLAGFKILSFDFFVENVFGGACIGVAGHDGVVFYGWDGKVVGKVEVECKNVFWDKQNFIIQSTKSFFVLKLTRGDSPFELIAEINDSIQSGLYSNGFFFYINDVFRFSVVVGETTLNIGHTNKANLLLGYVPNHERFFFFDFQNKLSSYLLTRQLIDLLKAPAEQLVSGDKLSPEVEALSGEERDFLSRSLTKQPEIAYLVCANPRWKFDLGLKIGRLSECLEICQEQNDVALWRRLGSTSLDLGQFSLAEKAFEACRDWSSLLLLFSSLGNRDGLTRLGTSAKAARNFNVAFSVYWQLNELDHCLDILLEQESFGQASALAKNFLPHRFVEAVNKWKTSLESGANAAAHRFIDPVQFLESDQMKLVSALRAVIAETFANKVVPASRFDAYWSRTEDLDLLKMAAEKGIDVVKEVLAQLARDFYVGKDEAAKVNQEEIQKEQAKLAEEKEALPEPEADAWNVPEAEVDPEPSQDTQAEPVHDQQPQEDTPEAQE